MLAVIEAADMHLGRWSYEASGLMVKQCCDSGVHIHLRGVHSFDTRKSFSGKGGVFTN